MVRHEKLKTEKQKTCCGPHKTLNNSQKHSKVKTHSKRKCIEKLHTFHGSQGMECSSSAAHVCLLEHVPEKGKGQVPVPQEPKMSVPRGRWRQGPPQQVSAAWGSCQPPHSRRSLGWSFQQELQVAICHYRSGRRRTTRKKSVLETALKKAQMQAVCGSSCTRADRKDREFIERPKRRVVHVKEYVQWAMEWKVECDKELADAEERLSSLRIEVERPMPPVPDTTIDVQWLLKQLNGRVLQSRLHCRGSDGVDARSALQAMHQRWAGCQVSWCKQRQVSNQSPLRWSLNFIPRRSGMCPSMTASAMIQ